MKNSMEYNSYPPIFQEFISYKSVIQGCSEKTVEEYTLDLKIFFKFLIATRCGVPTDGEEFDEITVDYLCDCTRERMLTAVGRVGKSEILTLLAEEERDGNGRSLEVTCRFCDAAYRFTEEELLAAAAEK